MHCGGPRKLAFGDEKRGSESQLLEQWPGVPQLGDATVIKSEHDELVRDRLSQHRHLVQGLPLARGDPLSGCAEQPRACQVSVPRRGDAAPSVVLPAVYDCTLFPLG